MLHCISNDNRIAFCDALAAVLCGKLLVTTLWRVFARP
jgi:hypothetical protein